MKTTWLLNLLSLTTLVIVHAHKSVFKSLDQDLTTSP